ncbi:MAG: bifunctional (p)ppGpp synthetase/guanosine-3',5'-bis(diphosphate) 3'-pyrophosphohydrolase [Clostridia bacterium]|nr:bifunctional (p)ppGpp synthetase/guanosine-3',5'-bis(diphosphate) 3'-pyrophosphohydrolase [Clostridia bacterium]
MYAAIAKLVMTLDDNNRSYDMNKIKRAYKYAYRLHDGQFRISGEPYIMHPIAVAEIVASLGLDTDSVCAALLHDTVEDCGSKISLEIIEKEFGKTVAQLVDGLTKLVQIPFDDKEEEHMENLRKMFLAMAKDVRVIFIKLCDRLHNMRTLMVKTDKKRRLTALETMQVYAPLAHRLGMQRIKQELENLSLRYLDPIGYEEVSDDIESKYGQNIDFIARTKRILLEKLGENGLSFSIDGRVKSVYSIYRKMFSQNKSFDEIYDFYAFRIITDDDIECYTVLGIIHDAFKSMPGRFKDYISTPKPNMYQSLHTTVIGRDGIPFEVQIRTKKMHQIAEYGVAAHWKYKSGIKESDESFDEKLKWISKLIESEEGTHDSEEFMRALKVDIVQDEIFVFTPKGDVITLPQGATLIDFAYAIHSAVGNKMVGAKINGMIAPIDRIPENGDIVQIITSASSRGPSRDWLKIVKTGEARAKIRQWFKKEKRAENVLVGKAEIEREFKKYNRPYTPAQRDEILQNVTHRLGIASVDDLYNTIGFGGLTVAKISVKLRDEFDRVVGVEEAPKEELKVEKIVTRPHKKNKGGVIIDGVDGCEVKFARCCNPLPGDEIVGFITKGFGISIHKCDCPNVIVAENNPENRDRFVSAAWEENAGKNTAEHNLFEAILQVFAEQDMMLLANLTMALADMKVSLHQINTQTKQNGIIVNMTVGCRDIDHFKSIMSRLRSIAHVIDVKRGYT